VFETSKCKTHEIKFITSLKNGVKVPLFNALERGI
jgi:hypothetical protein